MNTNRHSNPAQEIIHGEGGLDKVSIGNPQLGRVEIYLHGAHVITWMTPDNKERLFLSKKADFRAESAIRGGIPIVFPQFSNYGPLPKHGFARTETWKLTHKDLRTAKFTLRENKTTSNQWPNSFKAEYDVTLAPYKLCLALSITNTGDKSFAFTSALHSYFRVDDICQIQIDGLRGCKYLDAMSGSQELKVQNDKLMISGEIDRIYCDASERVKIISKNSEIKIDSTGFNDIVVWNPGREKAEKLSDLEHDDYLSFVCIESGVIIKPVNLEPGNSWQGSQAIIVN